MGRLGEAFYRQPARTVAKNLLGKQLVRKVKDQRSSGIIVETEAYCDGDEPDLACHGDKANKGRPTKRTEVMFGPAGIAYVYFTYGMHWMFNIVTGDRGIANAVLIRALEPLEGQKMMAANRPGREQSDWTNGPAKLAKALAIDHSLNNVSLCQPSSIIWVEDEPQLSSVDICIGPRIGLGKTPEPWLSKPWRFWICGNSFVSK